MIIQKLEPSKNKEGRWLVWFEDGSLVRVGEGDVVSLSLYAGKELSDDEAAALTAAVERGKLMEKAVSLLSLRPMSRRELLDKLTEPPRRRRKPGAKTAEPPEPHPETLRRQSEALRESAEAAADRLEELGLLNDGEYAKAVVRHYSAKGYGVRKLRDELYRRGVPRELWDGALDEAPPAGEEAYDLARKKLRDGGPTRENLKKVSDYLARRGFGWEEISAALDRLREDQLS